MPAKLLRALSDGGDTRQRLQHQLSCHSTQACRQIIGGLQQSDRASPFQQHRPRVQPLLHSHHADTGLPVSFSRLHWIGLRRANAATMIHGRSSIRAVVVEHGSRQDWPKATTMERSAFNRSSELALQIPADPFRSEHRAIKLERHLLHRRWHQLFSTSPPTVRLRDYTDQLMSGGMQCFQRWDGVLGCAQNSTLMLRR